MFLAKFENDWMPDNYGHIIVVGDLDEASFSAHTRRVLAELEALCVVNETEGGSCSCTEEWGPAFERFLRTLTRTPKKSLWALCGLAEFSRSYPGCVVKRICKQHGGSGGSPGEEAEEEQSELERIPLTPAHIHGNVFLGDRQILRGHCVEMVRSCRIDRILVSDPREADVIQKELQRRGSSNVDDVEVLIMHVNRGRLIRICSVGMNAFATLIRTPRNGCLCSSWIGTSRLPWHFAGWSKVCRRCA